MGCSSSLQESVSAEVAETKTEERRKEGREDKKERMERGRGDEEEVREQKEGWRKERIGRKGRKERGRKGNKAKNKESEKRLRKHFYVYFLFECTEPSQLSTSIRIWWKTNPIKGF